jgi:hypothetical protein
MSPTEAQAQMLPQDIATLKQWAYNYLAFRRAVGALLGLSHEEAGDLEDTELLDLLTHALAAGHFNAEH